MSPPALRSDVPPSIRGLQAKEVRQQVRQLPKCGYDVGGSSCAEQEEQLAAANSCGEAAWCVCVLGTLSRQEAAMMALQVLRHQTAASQWMRGHLCLCGAQRGSDGHGTPDRPPRPNLAFIVETRMFSRYHAGLPGYNLVRMEQWKHGCQRC